MVLEGTSGEVVASPANVCQSHTALAEAGVCKGLWNMAPARMGAGARAACMLTCGEQAHAFVPQFCVCDMGGADQQATAARSSVRQSAAPMRTPDLCCCLGHVEHASAAAAQAHAPMQAAHGTAHEGLHGERVRHVQVTRAAAGAAAEGWRADCGAARGRLERAWIYHVGGSGEAAGTDAGARRGGVPSMVQPTMPRGV